MATSGAAGQGGDARARERDFGKAVIPIGGEGRWSAAAAAGTEDLVSVCCL